MSLVSARASSFPARVSARTLAWLAASVVLALAVVASGTPTRGWSEREPIWRESWSERFPGCVATVLWPPGERPVALVTRDPAGQLSRVSVAEAAAGAARTVGACRRSS